MGLSLYKSGNQKQAIENTEAALKIREEIEDRSAEKVRRKLAEWREKEEECLASVFNFKSK